MTNKADRRELACCLPIRNPGPEFMETLRSFETCAPRPFLIVVDDGSAAPVSVDFAHFNLEGLVLRCDPGVGVAAALNLALGAALDLGFETIARMDGDDLNHPDRFARQLAYLDAHPDCLAVFAGADLIDAAGGPAGHRSPPGDLRRLARAMALNNVLIHPTAVLRRAYVSRFGLYSCAYPFAEDYEYFLRGLVEGVVHVMAERLISYRIADRSVSFSRYREQLVSRLRIQLRYLGRFGLMGWIGIGRTLALIVGGTLLPRGVLGVLRRGWQGAA